MQLGCTQYETHKFIRRHVQCKSVARLRATQLQVVCMAGLARNLHGELAHKLVKFCTKLHMLRLREACNFVLITKVMSNKIYSYFHLATDDDKDLVFC